MLIILPRWHNIENIVSFWEPLTQDIHVISFENLPRKWQPWSLRDEWLGSFMEKGVEVGFVYSSDTRPLPLAVPFRTGAVSKSSANFIYTNS